MSDRPTAVFDRRLLDMRRRRHFLANPDSGAGFLLDAVARELAERLDVVERHFAIAVELAGHTGRMADHLRASGKVDRVIRIERTASLLNHTGLCVVADEEALPLAAGCIDLVVSPLSLHLTNDTPGTLVQIRRALKPDGLFLCGFLGGDTLNELRAALLAAESELVGGASPRVAPFADVRDAGGLLQRAGFALPVADQERLTVRYDSLFALMTDIRAMGMANMLTARSRRPVSKRFFLRAAEIYAERFADPDGRIRATFDVIYMSGWCPDESQQKPLKPGSAKISLADALKERSDKN